MAPRSPGLVSPEGWTAYSQLVVGLGCAFPLAGTSELHGTVHCEQAQRLNSLLTSRPHSSFQLPLFLAARMLKTRAPCPALAKNPACSCTKQPRPSKPPCGGHVICSTVRTGAHSDAHACTWCQTGSARSEACCPNQSAVSRHRRAPQAMRRHAQNGHALNITRQLSSGCPSADSGSCTPNAQRRIRTPRCRARAGSRRPARPAGRRTRARGARTPS